LPEIYQRFIKVIYPNIQIRILLGNMNCHRTTTQERFPKLIIVSEVWEKRIHLGDCPTLTPRIS
jgi:hypothetical protein